MDSREPVYHINWTGSNGNVSVDVLDYTPTLLSILLNTLSLNLDGSMLLGSLQNRGNSGPGSPSGKGSADGRKIEVKIPFTQISRQNSSGNVIDQLAFGENFKFHVSTINGNISSIPGLNSINDNFGGCLTAPSTILSPTLPIKLSEFSARYEKSNVLLNWESSLETDFSHFVIESSTDGIVFSSVAVVFGSATNGAGAMYSYKDRSVAGRQGIVYYRLKMVDIDGKEYYSAVRVIMLGEAKSPISITSYPNPVSNDLRISIPLNWQGKKTVYEILNVSGQVARKIETGSSSQTETINVSNMAPGFYIVRVTCDGQTAQQKIVKQ